MAPSTIEPRLRRVLDLMVASAREESGRHEYDGQLQDLSDTGVRQSVTALGGEPLADGHDHRHLTTFEAWHRVRFAEMREHRVNPLVHLANMELACYDRSYAPEEDRMAAKRRHLKQWPDAVDMAISSLDQVPGPVATALTDAVAGLATDVPADWPEADAALAAHARFVAHIRMLAQSGPPDTAIGEANLARLMSAAEGVDVDLTELRKRALQEGSRLQDLLDESCQRLDPAASTQETVALLLRDHPTSQELISDAAVLTDEVIRWTAERSLAPHLDGECVVGESPPSRRWATAMLSWAAPGDPDSPSNYDITPPDEAWPVAEQNDWLSMFNRTSMQAITVHEVAPGHFAHGRSLRHLTSPVRQTLIGGAFTEGWAHYAEEMVLDEGFHADDPRYAIGMCLEALCRLTRLTCAIALHSGEIDVAEASRRFRSQAYLSQPVALSEARRGTFDPGYGMYTWGKWEILKVREKASAAWGAEFTLPRFHAALMTLGGPPLGLLESALTHP